MQMRTLLHINDLIKNLNYQIVIIIIYIIFLVKDLP